MTTRRSVCPLDCPSVCALDIDVVDERTIGRIYGNKEHPYTDGVICAKVSRYAQRNHHPDRITQPYIRKTKKGSTQSLADFTPASWDEALDLITERFQSIIAQHGAQAIWPYHYAGTMGLVQRDGLDRLRHTLGTSRLHATFCVTLADAGWIAGTGAKRGADAKLMAESDVIVVWGGNPVNTQVNVMNYIAKARKARAAKLIVVDPYLTRTAQKADQHLMLKPGTDGALACAVMHVLFRDGFADREYINQYTSGVEQLEQHLSAKTPQWAAQITGLSVDEITQFAHTYGASQASFMRLGYGFSRSRNGAVNMHAASCLPAITGAWKIRGGGALYGNSSIYTLDRSLITGSDVASTQTRILDQSRIGQVLAGNPDDLQGGPQVMALLIQNTNPAVVAPETNTVLQGLARDDLFTVVHEHFLTDTAMYADVLLPATMFTEHDDLYQSSGHTYLQVAKKLIDAPEHCRSNHWLVCQLASRLGLNHPGFDLTEWELIDRTLKNSAMPEAQTLYEQGGYDCAPAFNDEQFLNGFDTPDKRFHFKPDWSSVGPHSAGMPTLPDHWACNDIAKAKHPYRLVAAPARQFLNTTFSESPWARKAEKRPHVKIHPEDLIELCAAEGELVRLGNDQGEVSVRALAFSGVQRGTVVVEGLWRNTDFAGGVGINVLVSAEPGKPNGGAVFHDTAIWIKKSI
jgi:anaerobic selenocysteine-containing dehydrogenase